MTTTALSWFEVLCVLSNLSSVFHSQEVESVYVSRKEKKKSYILNIDSLFATDCMKLNSPFVLSILVTW